jgi:hypothetical protein
MSFVKELIGALKFKKISVDEIVQSDLAQTVNSPDFNYFEFIKDNPEEKLTEFLKMP